MSSIHSQDSEEHSPTVRQAEFPFDAELDFIWIQCEKFSQSINQENQGRIHPFHLALVLLFKDLIDGMDKRLIGQTVSHPQKTERPLFWAAIERTYKASPPKTLDLHIQMREMSRQEEKAPVQMKIGQAIWEQVRNLTESQLVEASMSPNDKIIPMTCTEETRLLLTEAKNLSIEFGDTFITAHHALICLLRIQEIRTIIEDQSIDVDELSKMVRNLRNKPTTEYELGPQFFMLNQFGRNITEEISEKLRQKVAIDPLIGRTHEMRRLISVLSRLTKNNAVLLGESGVGKTAIAEALAYKIVMEEVPESVVAHVFSLDLASLLASTACKSSYEWVLERILREIEDHEARGIKVILFLDDLSQITIGGYRDNSVGIDAATLMKPFLISNKLRCVGCSTHDDYRTSIEKDGALARLFSTIMVCEPTVPETVDILRGLKAGLEEFHEVKVIGDALHAAAAIAAQFFPHKRLPDSAIELLDEACSATKIGANPTWEAVGTLKREKIILSLEIQSLEREYSDRDAPYKLQNAHSRIQQIEEELKQHKKWSQESRPIRQKIESLEKEVQEMEEEYKKTGERERKTQEYAKKKLDLKGEIEELKRSLYPPLRGDGQSNHEGYSDPGYDLESNGKLVTKHSIVVAASWFRPISYSGTNNASRNASLSKAVEDTSRVVVGQPEAIEVVTSAVRCMVGGLTDPSKPIASFLFAGPTSSGKVLLAKELAKTLLGTTARLVRINGSDYATPHTLSRLIGTPACTGLDQGGLLTECIRRKPFSVILVHRIEDACPEFRLQIQGILEDGCLRDGNGKVVDFTNSIVIITTGIGQDEIGSSLEETEERNQYEDAITTYFPVDFLSRIDEVVIFRCINAKSVPLIIESRLNEIREWLYQLKIQLEVSEEVKRRLETEGWGLHSNARDLEKAIRSEILLPLSTVLLQNRNFENWRMEVRWSRDRGTYVEPIEPAQSPSTLNMQLDDLSSNASGTSSSLQSTANGHPGWMSTCAGKFRNLFGGLAGLSSSNPISTTSPLQGNFRPPPVSFPLRQVQPQPLSQAHSQHQYRRVRM
ncbi:P-loop containing nucleoside triphosphate hydrolase protein [Serendipita vermifera]|nr:P-loop containing nucleoside triphosphate hydrolase protein [Serendipita vermifera]